MEKVLQAVGDILERTYLSKKFAVNFANLEMRHSIFLDNMVVSPLVMGVLWEKQLLGS
jgi:hypothetical protein